MKPQLLRRWLPKELYENQPGRRTPTCPKTRLQTIILPLEVSNTLIPFSRWEFSSPCVLLLMALVHSARTAPLRASKATCNWRVVDPQRSRVKDVPPPKPPCALAADLRPRVWTGVRHASFFLSLNANFVCSADFLYPLFYVPQCREGTNCSLHFPPWRRTVGESLGKVCAQLSFSFPMEKMVLASGGGVMIFGMAAGLHFQCRFSFLTRQSPTLPCFSEASATRRYRTHWLLSPTASVRLMFLSNLP